MLEKIRQRFNNKKILVMGLGIQGGGLGLVNFLSQFTDNIRVTDLKSETELKTSLKKISCKNISYTLGKHLESDFLWADIIIKGPSVKWDNQFVQFALKNNREVLMEMSIFFEFCPAKIIGITGTRGKSTTTHMSFGLIKKAIDDKLLNFNKVYLAGNVAGISTIELLNNVTKNDLVVLELSSWQLSGLSSIKKSPWISIFTNIFPDHFNYYLDETDYLNDKKNIYLYQLKNDYLIANYSLKSIVQKDNPQTNVIFFEKKSLLNEDFILQGDHNKENIAAVIELAKILKINDSYTKEYLKSFKGLSFRQEKIAEINGIDVINDTTSTTPIATEVAIDAYKSRNIILILGGMSKSLPLGNLLDKIDQYVKKIVLISGTFTDEILPFLDENKLINKKSLLSLTEAFDLALKSATQGDIILFSPGATSFNMFKNEFHRGEEFSRIVMYATKKNNKFFK